MFPQTKSGKSSRVPPQSNYFFKSSKLGNMTNKTQLVYPNTSQNNKYNMLQFCLQSSSLEPCETLCLYLFLCDFVAKSRSGPSGPQHSPKSQHHSSSFTIIHLQKKVPAIHSSMKVLMVLKGQTCMASGAAPRVAPSACGVAGSSTTLLVSKVPLEQQSKRTSGGEGEDGDFVGFRWVKQCHKRTIPHQNHHFR